jgi:hypothetical protein
MLYSKELQAGAFLSIQAPKSTTPILLTFSIPPCPVSMSNVLNVATIVQFTS